MKIKKSIILLVFLLGTVFILTGMLPAHAKTIRLTYSNFFPPTHIQSKLAESWCKEVEKRTQGEVVVQYFPGQTLTQARQVYDGVVTGLSDVGMALFAYTRGRFPVMEAVDLPLGYPNGKTATKVVNDVYQTFKPKELKDTQVMYLHAHGPGILHTKDRPVKSLADFKGMKLRGTGVMAQVIKALGATPVSMPMPELYQSLQKGVVEGAMYPIEVNKGWKMGEVTKFTTESYSIAYTLSFFVVMNKERWNDLSDKNKKIIKKINAEWIPKHGEAWDSSDREGIKYSHGLGHRFIKLDAKESAKWKKTVAPVINTFIRKMNEKGFDGEKIVNHTKESLKKHR